MEHSEHAAGEYNGGMRQQAVAVIVSEILSKTLGVNQIAADDDFFELGGTSLGLIGAVAQMSSQFNLNLDTSIVLDGANVMALSRAVTQAINARDGKN
jgi:hypothetical protein